MPTPTDVLWLLCSLALALLVLCLAGFAYLAFVVPRRNPLRNLPGPPSRRLFDHSHMNLTIDPVRSPRAHEYFVKHYGRQVHIRGPLPWDDRLLTLDPVSIAHVLKNTSTYEKPWQARSLIESLIGCGMLAAEGQVHKRQRRVATPAFSIQNLRNLEPLVFNKGVTLKEKWVQLLKEAGNPANGLRFDVCDWVSRATFDVIGSAGFDYQFNAIENGDNELFRAYKDMFEVAVSQQSNGLKAAFIVYVPYHDVLFPDEASRTVKRCRAVIERVAGQLIQEKKRKLSDAEKSGSVFQGKDLLTLLLKSNVAADLPSSQRISDEDILNNINTFMFAGTDTTSLSITWTLLLLAMYPDIQTKLREECRSIMPSTALQSLTEEEVQSLYSQVADLPYLDKIVKESLRLIPPLHSSIRVATKDDVLPTSSPIKRTMPDGTIIEEEVVVTVPKGSFVHVPVEAFNMDKEVWGEDAWSFVPDRWDNLPETVKSQPGIYANLMTFSAGPRACIGMRFSIIEMKSFLFILLANFVFSQTDEKIGKANVVLTRPYIMGKHREGSQCPLKVRPYNPDQDS
ncbi:cytochrome-450 hydroxylase [Panus rudis PR-1116 ss-1]|nr:cytochrome-450 hydroxylase [Panus rudis PR-1116 ss-1]